MEIDKALIESIIRSVIKEELAKTEDSRKKIDPSGIMSYDPRGMELEPFPLADAPRVTLKDLFTVEESPRIGAGVMELDHSSLDWTLTYDEFDYVIEGVLEILIDGRKVRAEAGEVIYIPKNSKITFSTPEHARFFYVVYPANWADLV
jgi:ethanolamine utilization protein EutQ